MNSVFIRASALVALGAGVVFASIAEAQALVAVQSRKIHASAGTHDIQIDFSRPIGSAVTVEPRAIGAGHIIVFQFDSAAVAPASVDVIDLLGMPVGIAASSTLGAEVSVSLTGIPDNSRVTISLRDGGGTAYASASMGFLLGDVNNTRSISENDVSAIKARSGLSANGTRFAYDLNTTGTIGASDIAAVKARVGQVLVIAGQAGPGEAYVSWNAVTGATGYRVYYTSNNPGDTNVYSQLIGTGNDAGNVLFKLITGLTSGQTYYFAVTAYNIDGYESEYSDKVSKVIS